jgi:F0F1-type ATP synthase assembly protein I
VTGPKGPTGREGRFFADVLSFGWVLPASIAAGAGAGWLLDRLLGTWPVLTAVLGVLGLAAGLRQLLREAEALSEPDPPGGKGPPEGGGT